MGSDSRDGGGGGAFVAGFEFADEGVVESCEVAESSEGEAGSFSEDSECFAVDL